MKKSFFPTILVFAILVLSLAVSGATIAPVKVILTGTSSVSLPVVVVHPVTQPVATTTPNKEQTQTPTVSTPVASGSGVIPNVGSTKPTSTRTVLQPRLGRVVQVQTAAGVVIPPTASNTVPVTPNIQSLDDLCGACGFVGADCAAFKQQFQ